MLLETSFLICFPMKYWDFSVKSKSILPLVVTSEITILIFTVSKNGLFMNSGLKVLPKGLKYSILVWNYGERTLTFRDGTADVTYCAVVTLTRHATSGRLSLTEAFSLRRILALYCFSVGNPREQLIRNTDFIAIFSSTEGKTFKKISRYHNGIYSNKVHRRAQSKLLLAR